MSSFKRRSDYEDFLQLQQTLAQKVSKRDKEFSYYVGADLETGYEMAFLDVVLREKLILHKKAISILKLYRMFLNQNRKAFFGITISEFSQLGLILGETRIFKNATATAIK